MRSALLVLAAAPLVLGSGVVTISCSASSASSSGVPLIDAAVSPPAVHRTDPSAVHVVGKAFRDGQGRQLLLRGYNVKVPTLYDVTFDDGRVPEETFPDLIEPDAALVEQLGWNVMRIPVSWSGLEPHPLQYSTAFLTRLDTVLATAKAHGFYVIVDMHQDGYSKEIGQDGEPLWAIEPPPAVLLQGPYSDARRTAPAALNAGFSFFDDSPAADGRPLQTAYVEAVKQIARHVVGNPAVLGYEAFNEPVVLRADLLDRFHALFADGVHAVDADAPVLFEPVGTRNETDSAVVPLSPWAHGPGAYAVHVYTCWFSTCTPASWATEDPSALAPSMAHAETERAGWGTPLIVTEFGCDQTLPQAPAWMSAELDLQDKYLASSTAWELWAPDGWGFVDHSNSPRPASMRVMARTFPRAVAGTLLGIERPKPGDMVVTYQASAATNGKEHEVSLSGDYVTSPRILCDGAAVPFTQASGRATFTCPAKDEATHTFEVVGTPVP